MISALKIAAGLCVCPIVGLPIVAVVKPHIAAKALHHIARKLDGKPAAVTQPCTPILSMGDLDALGFGALADGGGGAGIGTIGGSGPGSTERGASTPGRSTGASGYHAAPSAPASPSVPGTPGNSQPVVGGSPPPVIGQGSSPSTGGDHGAAPVTTVPEPGVWVSMIVGFALVGGRMRSQRVVA